MAIRRLAAFDFDNTIADENTDYVIKDLLDQSKITEDIQKLYSSSGWIDFMQAIFKLLHENGFKKTEILNRIRKIPEVAGMTALIKALKLANFDLIIISDSNSEFISSWCAEFSILDEFQIIYTNPAKFTDEEQLHLNGFHVQKECDLSSQNLCKGKVLQDYLDERQRVDNIAYRNVFYVGDGQNDICPVLRLGKSDFGCARIDFVLDKKIHEVVEKNAQCELNAQLIRWTNGYDLLESILEHSRDAVVDDNVTKVA